MNANDQHMVDLLRRGKDCFGYVAVKAEFEAEGVRPEEFLRLLEIARKADLQVALKIGGCEAVSDLHASLIFGVDHIIAPMVESEYALTKFIQARDAVYGPSMRPGCQFLFNVETRTALANFPAMAKTAKGRVDGVVFGRVDYTLSTGATRAEVNGEATTQAVLEVATICAETDLSLVVGGSVTLEAVAPLSRILDVRLDRFETRKVVFDGKAMAADHIQEGITQAIEFELCWLRAKRDYYERLAAEDQTRIAMIEARLRA